MTEKPSNLADALAQLQTNLPEVDKGNTAEVKSERTGKAFKYKYADLADVSKAVLPKLGPLGLSWITRPTVTESGKFVLAYELLHTSGESRTGEYPLQVGTPQEMGSAITYARRYALCSVTGVAPESDDDDGAHASSRQTDNWEAAQPASKSQAEMFVGYQRAIAACKTADDFAAVGSQVKGASSDGTISHWQYEQLARAAAERMAGLRAAETPEVQQ